MGEVRNNGILTKFIYFRDLMAFKLHYITMEMKFRHEQGKLLQTTVEKGKFMTILGRFEICMLKLQTETNSISTS